MRWDWHLFLALLKGTFHVVRTHLGGGGGSLLYISIVHYMQKGGGWVQIACATAYVLNEKPHTNIEVGLKNNLADQTQVPKFALPPRVANISVPLIWNL